MKEIVLSRPSSLVAENKERDKNHSPCIASKKHVSSRSADNTSFVSLRGFRGGVSGFPWFWEFVGDGVVAAIVVGARQPCL